MSGGLIPAALTSISGASEVFYAGGVFYDTDAKIRFLQIDEGFIKKYGVYSEECAKKMAKNFKDQCEANICVSTTGEAEGEHAGRVYFGITANRQTKTFSERFTGNRQEVQIKARDFALKIMRDAVILL